MNQTKFMEFITSSLKESTSIALHYYKKVIGTTKIYDDNQVVTKADLEIGAFLIKSIEKNYPDHNIIDEERGAIDKGSDYTWVIDPIDGTSNYAAGVPTYGIMLGLIKDNKAYAGGVIMPSLNNEVYIAQRGEGAYLNGRELHVTDFTSLKRCLLAYGIDSHPNSHEMTLKECAYVAEVIEKIRNLRSSNSVFDIAMLLEGRYAGVLNRNSRIWDNVAAEVLVEEAGGKYVDFYGKNIEYNSSLNRINDNYEFIAIAPQFLQEILEVYKP